MRAREFITEKREVSLDGIEDLFEMANLRPSRTGLPMVIWISHRGFAKHDARVKVAAQHGDKIDPSNLVTVGIRPEPHMIDGELSSADQKIVFAWVALNAEALIEFWDGKLDTSDVLARLQRV